MIYLTMVAAVCRMNNTPQIISCTLVYGHSWQRCLIPKIYSFCNKILLPYQKFKMFHHSA